MENTQSTPAVNETLNNLYVTLGQKKAEFMRVFHSGLGKVVEAHPDCFQNDDNQTTEEATSIFDVYLLDDEGFPMGVHTVNRLKNKNGIVNAILTIPVLDSDMVSSYDEEFELPLRYDGLEYFIGEPFAYTPYYGAPLSTFYILLLSGVKSALKMEFASKFEFEDALAHLAYEIEKTEKQIKKLE